MRLKSLSCILMCFLALYFLAIIALRSTANQVQAELQHDTVVAMRARNEQYLYADDVGVVFAAGRSPPQWESDMANYDGYAATALAFRVQTAMNGWATLAHHGQLVKVISKRGWQRALRTKLGFGRPFKVVLC
jgi:hypothetical protein